MKGILEMVSLKRELVKIYLYFSLLHIEYLLLLFQFEGSISLRTYLHHELMLLDFKIDPYSDIASWIMLCVA